MTPVEEDALTAHQNLLLKNIAQMQSDAGFDGNAFAARLAGQGAKYRATNLAVLQAVHEMLWTSGRAQFGEEHQTASLMGHLATNFTWYALAATAAAKDEERGQNLAPDVRWAYQSKNEEARSGVDFGIAVNFTGSAAPDAPIRLVLFQAKLCKHRASNEEITIDVGHVVGPKAVAKTPDTGISTQVDTNDITGEIDKSPSQHLRQRCMTPAFRQLLDANSKFIHSGEAGDVLSKLPKHQGPAWQLEALIKTNLLGRSYSPDLRAWCFYAAWTRPFTDAGKMSKIHAPIAITIDGVAAYYAKGALMPGLVKHQLNGGRLVGDVIADVISEDNPSYGIEVPLNEISSLAGELCKLLPTLHLTAVSDTEEGGNALAQELEGHMTVTPATPTPAPQPKQTAQVSAAMAKAAQEATTTPPPTRTWSGPTR